MPLPVHSSFLAGRGPVDADLGVRTQHIQIYYRLDDDTSTDERAHAHTDCDEFFIVLSGAIVFDVAGQEHRVGAREFCHFPTGVFHRIRATEPPLEAFATRAPSVQDKVYPNE